MSLLPEDGGDKRPRDDETEALIQAALDEEQRAKRAKKGLVDVPAVKAQRKGKTLREIEEAEGGPVKESYVGMAAVQRALRRKHAPVDETELPDDLAACEEDDGDGAAEEGEQQEGEGEGEGEGDGEGQQRGRAARYGGRKVPRGVSDAVAAMMEGDGGYAVTGFNMRQERDEGNIDEEGNFVPAQDEDDETGKDAWLNSDEAKPVSAAAAAAAKARAVAMAAADDAPSLSDTAMAKTQREIASLLLPGETVTAGLRRLGAASGQDAGGKGKAMGKREKQRLAQQQQQAGKKQAAGAAAGAPADGQPCSAAAAAAAFDRLTELADLLLNSGGELTIYSQRKEQLEREAAAVLPQTDLLAAAPAGGRDGGGSDDADMFADEDEQQQQQQQAKPQQARPGGQPQAAHGSSAAGAAAAAGEAGAPAGGSAPGANAPPAAEAAAPAADFASWPVKELRRFLGERGIDSSSIVEKQELIQQAQQAAAKGPATAKGPAAAAAPAGYAFDPASKLFWSAEAGLFYNPASGCFFNPTAQQWYRWDAAAARYEEVAAAAAAATTAVQQPPSS